MLLGADGEHWIENLPALLADLSARWQLDLQEQMSGGTEGVVVRVARADGTPAVLKIASNPVADEARVLQLAGGRGYAQLYAYDAGNNALLLEALGDKLLDHPYSVDEYLRIVCRTLAESWQPLGIGRRPAHGRGAGEMAYRLHQRTVAGPRSILPRTGPQRGACVCPIPTRPRTTPKPASSSTVDAQIWNTLLTGAMEDGLPVCRFVDPDGAFAEPACDLGVLQREWIDDLLAGGQPCQRESPLRATG